MEEKDTVLPNQIQIGDEKSKTIAHKASSLKRLDESFIKHIEFLEYKKANLLAYWFTDFANYHDNEKTFDSTTLKTFKRGDIVKVNLGFNIGDELGGLHYCVVINKTDNPYSGTLNVVPLSSIKEGKEYNTTSCINLGDELFLLLQNKINKQNKELQTQIAQLSNNGTTPVDISDTAPLLKKMNYIHKIYQEIGRMKHGSIAFVNQITTVSKQRLFKSPILSGIKLSNKSLDLIDEKIKFIFTK